jgi:hypothetical protein
MSLNFETVNQNVVAMLNKYVSGKNLKSSLDEWETIFSSLSKSGKKAVKKERDPNQPKKPKTSYLFFTVEQRKLLKDTRPTMTETEIKAYLSSRWASLSESEKNVYVQMFNVEREKYKKAMELYKNSGGVAPPQKVQSKPAVVESSDDDEDVRFTRFSEVVSKEIKKEHKKWSDDKVREELKERWEELDDDEKNSYLRKESKRVSKQ